MDKTDVKFTRPIKRILVMLLFLAVVGAVGGYLSVQITTVFLTNPELNGLIGFVFVIGVIVAFWHVFRLFGAVNWIEALAARTRGIENIRPPSLLVAMDPLRKRGASRALGSSSARSILDSVATRVDESRDTLRYISGLLIFLGLLGTFWGLAKTVPAVVETIRAMIRAGMNVARLNFSHGTHAEHRKRLETVREASQALDANVAIMLDTKGVEIRTRRLRGGVAELETGSSFDLFTEDWRRHHPLLTRPTYEASTPLETRATASPADEAILEALRTLGYIE